MGTAWRWMVLSVGLVLGASGCDDEPQSTPEGEEDRGGPVDAMGEGSADAMVDAMVDVSQDASTDGGGDAMPDATVEAMPDAAADAMPDPEPDAGPEPGPTHFIDRGRCFEHTPRCADAADCDPAEFGDCVGGRCRVTAPCGCASDADCAPGDLCVTNERVCGECVTAPGRCPDGACPVGEVCVDGFCRDDCPGLGDGPPLRCRGEPPAGPCDGRWAYLREAGTCVPVDGVACGPEDVGFATRADCVAHCRGPVACTVTLERVLANTEVETVRCPLSHGPGACIGLAHCLCELIVDDEPAATVRERRRGCAGWMTIPRGAITLADFCGGERRLGAVIDAIEGMGGIGPLFGAEVQVVDVSPGCADVAADPGTGPWCEDGTQNAWETGVDCGAMGCPMCQ